MKNFDKRTGPVAIERQPQAFSRQDYDLIIVGGGIYGVMLALQAVFRGLKPLLLERNDFGSGTSFNSLRIVHGGLRYLQAFDLRRFRESVRERQWFLTRFSEQVRPLPCLMPLYGDGLRRKSILRAALFTNDVLSYRRNRGVPSGNELLPGAVVGRADTVARFPNVRTDGLQGAALWYDAAMPDSQRVLMEALRWAVAYGATALNYMEVTGLSAGAGRIGGVTARDLSSGAEFEYHASVVVNAAGPWCMDIATMPEPATDSFFWPSLAWNLLTDRPAPSDCALAVVPQRRGAPTYFIHPWKGRLLVGTGHSAWSGGSDNPAPSVDQVQQTLDDLNSAIPGLDLAIDNVDRIFAGLLPATGPQSGDIATRPVIRDHSASGGPRGLFSICGVKFTTARQVAQAALDRIFGPAPATAEADCRRPNPSSVWQISVDMADEAAVRACLNEIESLILEEAPLHLQDLVFRRTNLWEQRDTARELAPRLCEVFGWSESRRHEELRQLEQDLRFGAIIPSNTITTATHARKHRIALG